MRFTTTWALCTTIPSVGDILSVSCSDPDQLFPSSTLTSPGASMTYTGNETSFENQLSFLPNFGINRVTYKLVTCTTSSSNPTFRSGQTSFYTGGILTLDSDVPSNVAVPSTAYSLVSTVFPSNALAVCGNAADEVFSVTCDSGVIVGSTPVTQTFNEANEALPHILMWIAPMIPQSSITCTYIGPAPPFPTDGLFDYYNVSTHFTMTVSTHEPQSSSVWICFRRP